MSKRLVIAGLIAGAALFGCAPPGTATPTLLSPSLSTGRPLALPATHGSFLGRMPASTRIDVYVQVAGRHDDELYALRGRVFTADAFGRYFGANPADYAQAIGLLRRHGFVIDDLPANRTDIIAHATAASVEALFQTPLDLRSDRGRVYYANRYDPVFPSELHAVAVSGLDDHGLLHPMLRRSPGAIIDGTFSWGPRDVAAAYDLNPLYSSKRDGKGVIIANATCGAAVAGDLVIFRTAFGLSPASLVSTAEPKGHALTTGCGSGKYGYGNGESSLDVDWALAVARGATFHQVVATGPTNHDFDLVYSYIVNHLGSAVHVVTTSWGSCEREMRGTPSLRIDERLFAQAAAEGQHWFAASGDNGTDDCQDGGHAVSVDFPGSSPYVTDVGGTNVQGRIVNGNVTGWLGETVWQESNSNGASGGGRSILFAKPSYQKGVTPDDGVRDVPDVALIADDVNDGLWMADGSELQPGWGGTSEAAPQWAGLFAILEQRFGNKLIADPHDRLYQLAASDKYHRYFHDITRGNNGVDDVYGTFPGFNAGPGFDLCSGWGSYIGAALVNAY
jgi:subtilase family serine protease